jgi:hypothetical protein
MDALNQAGISNISTYMANKAQAGGGP